MAQSFSLEDALGGAPTPTATPSQGFSLDEALGVPPKASIEDLGSPAGDDMGSAIMSASSQPKPARKVYTGSVFDTQPFEPEFNPEEAARLSRREYAEKGPAQPRRTQSMRATPSDQIERSVGRAIADTGIGLLQGAAGIPKGIASNINAGDNPVAQFFDEAIQAGERSKSPYLRSQQVEREALLKNVLENQGELAQTRAAFTSMFSPAGADVVAQGAGSMLPTMGMSLLNLGQKSFVAMNALANAGDAAQGTAKELAQMSPQEWSNSSAYQELRGAGLSHRDAVNMLTPLMAMPAQLVGAGAGAVSGSTGLEKTLAGKGIKGGARERVARAGAELAGEELETLAPSLVGNITQRMIDEKKSITEGLGREAVETLFGSTPGMALAASGRSKPEAPKELDTRGLADRMARERGFLEPVTRTERPAPAELPAPVRERVEPTFNEEVFVAPAPKAAEDLTKQRAQEQADVMALEGGPKTPERFANMDEAAKYDTPEMRLKQAEALDGNDVTGLIFGETESYGRAALKKKSLTAGYAEKKDNRNDASDAATVAFGTGNYGVFAPYEKLFPKTAAKLKAALTPTQAAVQPPQVAATPEAPVEPAPTAEETPQQKFKRLSSKSIGMTNAFRDRIITNQEFDKFKADLEAARQAAEQEAPDLSALSPAKREILEIADKLEAAGVKGFPRGMRSNARPEAREPDEKAMEFYRSKLQPYEEKQAAPEIKKYGLPEFFSDNEKEVARITGLMKSGPLKTRVALGEANDSIQRLADTIQAAGFDINNLVPGQVPDGIMKIKSQIGNIAARSNRLAAAAEAVQKKYKRADPQRVKGDVAGLMADVEEADNLIAEDQNVPSAAEQMEGVAAPDSPEVEELLKKSRLAAEDIEILSKRSAGTSLMKVLEGSLKDGEMSELAGKARKIGKNPFISLVAKKGKRGSSMEDMVESGKLNLFLPFGKRSGEPGYDNAESAEYIREKLRTGEYYTDDIRQEIESIQRGIWSIDEEIQQELSLEDINREIQYAVDEQRALDQETAELAPEGTPEALDEGTREEDELIKSQTKEELKAKQDEIDRLSKENERLNREAERKEKIDAEAGDFVLTGSNRDADKAAARGQMNLTDAEDAVTDFEANKSALTKLAEKLLSKGSERYEEAELDGKLYQVRTRTFDGKLFGSELQLVKDTIGLARDVNLINEEDRVMTLQLTGKNVGEGRNVRIMDSQYTEQEDGEDSDQQTFRSIEQPKAAKPSPVTFYEDIPNESWLQGKVDYAIRSPRNEFGVPKMSSVTGSFKNPVMVPTRWLTDAKGQRGEEKNVRQKDLDAIRKIIRETGKFPLNEDGTEYVPYIEIGYDGKPWVSEGNHRIMAAIAEGLEYIPVELRYFDGGQRRAGKWGPENVKEITERQGGAEDANITKSLEEDLVTLVTRMADEMAEDEKKRSPSLVRTLKTYNRQRNAGKMSEATYIMMSDAAIRADEERRTKEDPKDRERGYLHIQEKLSAAVRRGELPREAFDLANWFMSQNEDLVADLGISIKGKGPAGTGGFYNAMSRVMTLIKDGGSELTATHEILHHLERMMPAKVQQAIRKAWLDQLTKASKATKDPVQKLYFEAVLDANLGNNRHTMLNPIEGAGKAYANARMALEDMAYGNTSAKLAEMLLLQRAVPIDMYQYFNPSEFWAVNGSRIVQGRYDAVKGGVLIKMKKWLGELGQKIKSALGLKSDASIIRALDSLAKGDGKFQTDEMLSKGDNYAAITGKNVLNRKPMVNWTMPDSTNLDKFIYSIQNKQIDMKRAVDSIKDAVGQIDERFDPYMKETLFAGRTATQTKRFLQNELEPLFKEMGRLGVTMPELEEYLHNRHAPERNLQIAIVNPGMPDKGSGIATYDALNYMADLSKEQEAKYKKLAGMVDAITAGTRQLLVDSGLESQETINQWESTYDNYVPLNRDDIDYSSNHGMGVGQGYSVRGPASRRAVGSERKVVDILANIAMQRERNIVRAEKNRVAMALYGMAIQNPNPDFFLAVNPDAEKDIPAAIQELVNMGFLPSDIKGLMKEPSNMEIDPSTGLAIERIHQMKRGADNVMALRVNGENRYVFFNQNNERASRMASAIKNLDADQLGLIMSTMADATRFLAAMNTQYNPIFGAYNFLRDVSTAGLQLTNTPLAGKQAEVLSPKNVWGAMRGIYTDLRAERKGGAGKGDWAKLWEEFQQRGGQTGFRDQFSSTAKRGEALQRIVDPSSWANSGLGKVFTANGTLKVPAEVARKAAAPLFNWLSDYNETMENAIRLSAYKAGLDNGMSKDAAAVMAKELTVNFNRKGQIATQAGALYAFFNASVQGTTALAKTLSGPAGKKIIAGGLMLGGIQAVLYSMAGFDDKEPPDFIREKNFVIPIGNGKYIAIPLPLGYNVIPNTSRLLTEAAIRAIQGKKIKPTETLFKIFESLLGAFNPIGNAGWSFQTAAPTVADPIVALMENRDWTGKKIAREDFNSLDPTPGFTRYKESASTFSRGLAEFMNSMSGGTKDTPGRISPTPDQIDYFIGQIFGGVGREALKIERAARSVVTGEELPPHAIPFAGRFYGDTKGSSAVSNTFYENLKQMNIHENTVKGMRQRKENVQQYYKENPEARMFEEAGRVEREVQALRKRRRELVEKKAPKEFVQAAEARITARMKRFNDKIKQREEQQK